MPPVTLTAVVEGKDLDPQAFAREIRRVLESEANEIDKLYKMFYGTWDGEKPVMPKIVKMTGKDAYAEVSTRGHLEEFGNKKLLWIEEGTNVRWAVLSDGWVSKTKPGRVRSGGGRGRVLARGKGKTYFRRRGKPGLTARHVSKVIARFRGPRFQRNVDDAIERAAT